MNIVSDIALRIDPERMLMAVNNGREAKPKMVERMRQAAQIAGEVARPQIVYDLIPVQGRADEKLSLAAVNGNGGTQLHMGAHADLMDHSQLAFVSVQTIGAGVDEKARQLNASGDTLLSFLVDSAGVELLGQVGAHARQLAEKLAQERNWGVTAALSPGSLMGWSVEGQVQLCSLLPLSRIGVHLNDSCLLIPFKSVSNMIGLGPDNPSSKVGSICKFCMHRDSCWRRRANKNED